MPVNVFVGLILDSKSYTSADCLWVVVVQQPNQKHVHECVFVLMQS